MMPKFKTNKILMKHQVKECKTMVYNNNNNNKNKTHDQMMFLPIKDIIKTLTSKNTYPIYL